MLPISVNKACLIEINLATKKYVADALFLSISWASCLLSTAARLISLSLPSHPSLSLDDVSSLFRDSDWTILCNYYVLIILLLIFFL